MEGVGIFYGYVIGQFYGNLVYFVINWYIFTSFGMLYKEKSGNPDYRQGDQIGRIFTSKRPKNLDFWTTRFYRNTFLFNATKYGLCDAHFRRFFTNASGHPDCRLFCNRRPSSMRTGHRHNTLALKNEADLDTEIFS
jgi:hypothetical protein